MLLANNGATFIGIFGPMGWLIYVKRAKPISAINISQFISKLYLPDNRSSVNAPLLHECNDCIDMQSLYNISDSPNIRPFSHSLLYFLSKQKTVSLEEDSKTSMYVVNALCIVI